MAVAGGPNTSESGLVLCLDAGNPRSYRSSSTTWFDLSGNGYTGSINSAIYSTTNNGTLVFTGSNYAIISSSAAFAPSTNDFAFNAWINPSLWTGSWTNTIRAGYSAIYVVAGIGGMWIGKSGNNFVLRAYAVADLLQYSVLPATGSWTNLSISRTNLTASLYYNGTLVASSIVSHSFTQYSLYIGSDGPLPGDLATFSGSISSIQIYNRALSAQEVKQNYDALKTRFQ